VRVLIGLCLTLCFCLPSYAEGIPKEPVKVLAVKDGDTIEIVYQGKRERLRLEGIDAPELSQGIWGQRASSYLSTLLQDGNVSVQITGRDKYKRLLGYVYSGNKDVNQALVANGYSFAFLKYSYEFEQDEQQAKSNCHGFWCKDDKPIYPWVYRHSLH
jgi:micrococcal nuclease